MKFFKLQVLKDILAHSVSKILGFSQNEILLLSTVSYEFGITLISQLFITAYYSIIIFYRDSLISELELREGNQN